MGKGRQVCNLESNFSKGCKGMEAIPPHRTPDYLDFGLQIIEQMYKERLKMERSSEDTFTGNITYHHHVPNPFP